MNITCDTCGHASNDHGLLTGCDSTDSRTDTGLCTCARFVDRVVKQTQTEPNELPPATSQLEALCKLLADDGQMTPTATRQIILTTKLMIDRIERDLVEEVAEAVHAKLGLTSRALPIIRSVRAKAGI